MKQLSKEPEAKCSESGTSETYVSVDCMLLNVSSGLVSRSRSKQLCGVDSAWVQKRIG